MTRREMLETILESSPRASAHNAEQYLGAFLAWHEANDNIIEHGAIVVNPKSGEPMANPYSAVRDRSWKTMDSCRGVNGDALWEAYSAAKAGSEDA